MSTRHRSMRHASGFTIVELFIVVIVIAILATIAFVGYSNFQTRTLESILQADLRTAATKLGEENVLHKTYPSTIQAVKNLIPTTGEVTQFQYTYTPADNSYCLSATNTRSSVKTYWVSSANGSVTEGLCPGHIRPADPSAPPPPETSIQCFGGFSGNIATYYTHQGNNTANEPCPRDVVIPAKRGATDITTIGSNAFASKGITSVVIPTTVTIIADNAFNTNQLTSVILPEGLTRLANGAFAYNELTSVIIPPSITTFGTSTFAYNKISSIAWPSTYPTIPDSTFRNNLITTLDLPATVHQIGANAFNSNALQSVTVPDTLQIIGSNAFQNNQITFFRIPSAISSLGNRTFHTNPVMVVEAPTGFFFSSSSFPTGSTINRY